MKDFWELLKEAEKLGKNSLTLPPQVHLPCGCESPITGNGVYKGASGWVCTLCRERIEQKFAPSSSLSHTPTPKKDRYYFVRTAAP